MRSAVLFAVILCARGRTSAFDGDGDDPRDAQVFHDALPIPPLDAGRLDSGGPIRPDALVFDSSIDTGIPDAGMCPPGTRESTDTHSAHFATTMQRTVGNREWNDPGNIFARDSFDSNAMANSAQVAAMVSDQVSEFLVARDFDFRLPSNAAITGVELEVRRRSLSELGIQDLEVTLLRAPTSSG
jgi:hypothetical protein